MRSCMCACLGSAVYHLLSCLSEVKLSLASFLSDRIVDEILEALSTSQLTLVKSEEMYQVFFTVTSQFELLQLVKLHFLSYFSMNHGK